jgi:8-oxo-dGTP diphosphatase
MTVLRVVAGAIVRDGQVLLARRSPEMALPGCWELPGGKVEPGESDAEALERELLEELGVRVAVGPHLGTSRARAGARPMDLVAYRCTLLRGSPRPLEHDALDWVGPEALDPRQWAPADVPLVAPLREALRRG